MNGTLKTVISCVSSSVVVFIGSALAFNYLHTGSVTNFGRFGDLRNLVRCNAVSHEDNSSLDSNTTETLEEVDYDKFYNANNKPNSGYCIENGKTYREGAGGIRIEVKVKPKQMA